MNTYIIVIIYILRGSAIAKILGNNVTERNEQFETRINMYMYEEMVNGRKLTEIVNTDHENVKYLPGIKIPENVVRHSIAEYIMVSPVKDQVRICSEL